MNEQDQPFTRREQNAFEELLHEKFKNLESRLTYKILLANLAAAGFVNFASPVLAGIVAGLGIAGWGLKVAIAAIIHRG